MPKNLKYPNARYSRRCMWYNEFGEPRINPRKVEQGYKDVTGCFFQKDCHYVHPSDPDWLKAPFSNPPPRLYPDNKVPRTPTPPWAKRHNTSPEREPRVKEEPMSPTIPFASFDCEPAPAADARGSLSRSQSMNNRGPRTPPIVRNRYKDREEGDGAQNRDRDSRDRRDRDRDRDRDVRDRERDRDRDEDIRDRDRDYEQGRGKEREREHERTNHFANASMDRTQERWRTPAGSYDARRTSSSAAEPARTANDDLARTQTLRDHERDPAVSTPSGGLRTPSMSVSVTHWDKMKDRARDAAADRAQTPLQPLFLPGKSSSRTSISSGVGIPPPPDSAISAASFASSAMPPPPTPMSAASTASSAPLPTLPLFLTELQPESPKKQLLSLEEKGEIWNKRIELLEESVMARRAHSDLLEDLKTLKTHASSTRFALFPPAVRDTMAATISATEKQCADARTRVDAITEKICAMDFWPVRRRPTADGAGAGTGPVAELVDEHEELKTMVNDLGDAVRRIDRQLKEVVAYVASRARTSTSISARTAMEWEQQHDATRGVKRRKIGDEGAYASDSGTTVVGQVSPALQPAVPGTADALETSRLARRVEALEAMYADLENLCTQAEHQQTEEVAHVVDAHLDKLRAELQKGVRTKQTEAIAGLEIGLKQTGEELEELATTVTELVETSMTIQEKDDAYAAELERIARERAEIHAAIEQSRARTEEMQAQIRANIEETRALSLALQMARAPPPAPHVVGVDELVAALLPRLLDAVRGDLATRMAGARTELVQLVRASAPQIDLIREKVEKMQGLPEVLALVEGVNGMNGFGAGAGAPNMGRKSQSQQQNGQGHTLTTSP